MGETKLSRTERQQSVIRLARTSPRRLANLAAARRWPLACQAVATALESQPPEPPVPGLRRSPKSGKDWTKDHSDARNLSSRQASPPRLRSRQGETRNVREKHKHNHS